MKCTECPLTLVCYARTMRSMFSRHITYLCPICEKLIYFYRPRTGPYILYRFSCELRPVTNAIKECWKNYNNLVCVEHTSCDFPVWDRVYQLRVRECAPCKNSLATYIILENL